MPRTIAIGDIHGHLSPLENLLREIAPKEQDTIIFLGDYINRGPRSADVVERIIDLSKRCNVIPLMGNHEAMLLAALRTQQEQELANFRANGGDATLESYGVDRLDIPVEHRRFFESLQRYHEIEEHFFIHANYAPNFALSDQPEQYALWRSLEQIPARHYSRKTAVVGHTPQMNGEILDHEGYLICIDTGCGLGGVLTALDVHTDDYWQAEEGN